MFCVVTTLALLSHSQGGKAQVFRGTSLQNCSRTPRRLHHSQPGGAIAPLRPSHSRRPLAMGARYTLELYSDPRRLAPGGAGSSTLALTPPALSRRLSSPGAVTRSTLSRRPRVGLSTHTEIGRVSRFARLRVVPGWPVPSSPKPPPISLERGRRWHFSHQRPGAAAPAHLHACGYSSQSGRQPRHRAIRLNGDVQWGWQPPSTVQCRGRQPHLAVRVVHLCSHGPLGHGPR